VDPALAAAPSRRQSAFVVLVVAQHGDVVALGDCGDEQVRDVDGPLTLAD
jgi:hypothetical protein